MTFVFSRYYAFNFSAFTLIITKQRTSETSIPVAHVYVSRFCSSHCNEMFYLYFNSM